MIDFPVDTGESQGTMIGCDLISIGGFFPNFASGPRITYMLDLCDPSAQWRSMAEHPLEPFLTHAAHAHKGDDLMYLCGGYLGTHAGKSIKDCHVFNKTDGPIGSWRAMPSLPQRRGGGGLLYIESQDKLLFAMGAVRPRRNTDGVDRNNSWTLDVSGVNLDDPTTGAQWKFRSGGAPYLGNHVTSVKAKDCAGNTRYYFLGGQVGEREKDMNIDLVYEYVPSTDTFVQRQSMPQPRGHFTTANWPYGCGFITVGGAIDGDPTVNTWSDDVLYYDIDSDTWSDIGTYPELIKTPVCGIVSDVMYCANGYTVNSYKVPLTFKAASAEAMPTSLPTSTPTLTPLGTPTSSPVSALTVILDNDFSTSCFDGYMDNLFRDTSDGYYAQGWCSSTLTSLVVRLGGRDDNAVSKMSGGHFTSYTLAADASEVTVEMTYKVIFESDFEIGEDTEVLLSVEGVLYVVDAFYGVDSPLTTGWRTSTISVGSQLAGGPYQVAVGGYLSEKNASAERVRIEFDRVSIKSEAVSAATAAKNTSPPTMAPIAPVSVMGTDFTTNDFDGYRDDVFRNTSNGPYAQGWWASSAGGYLVVRLGGKDNTVVEQMSGGHETSYSLVVDATSVRVDFRYLVVFESDFEEGEDTEVLLSVDGVLYVVDVFFGVDNSSTTKTGLWLTASIDLGPQSGGLYALALGGFLSKKDETAERVRLQFDDVYVTAIY